MGLQRVRRNLATEQQQLKKKRRKNTYAEEGIVYSHGALCGGAAQGSVSQSYSNTLQIRPFLYSWTEDAFETAGWLLTHYQVLFETTNVSPPLYDAL